MEFFPDAAPLACSLGQDDLADRQRRWHALADRAIIDVAWTDRGMRLRFRAEPGVEAELHDLAALERDCCAFADWAVVTDGEAFAIDVRGTSAESVPVVQEMFTGLAAASGDGPPTVSLCIIALGTNARICRDGHAGSRRALRATSPCTW